MIINHNMNAINSHRQLGVNSTNLSKNTEKLSSGQRINRAGDDAAGLAISEKMRNQIKGLNQASRNAQDGISLIQTAEGALEETHEMLKRMRELTVQGSNGTLTTNDTKKIAAELKQLNDEITEISKKTEFNSKNLLSGKFSKDGLTFQTGANGNQTINVQINNMGASSLGITSVSGIVSTGKLITGSKSTVDTAVKGALSKIDSAIEKVSSERSKLGSIQNRLEHTIKSVNVSAENLQASESRIRDTDMAKEMMEFTKTNVLNQAAQSMLAQANQLPNQVLQLLR